MSEEANRKAITKDTARELYLKSGNECAFPGCTERIIDANGNYIGQLCHIEAAKDRGERFNANMTNEERRAFPNLLLLCAKHHVITNDVEKFTVERLQSIKADHEAKFSDIVTRIQNSIMDFTTTRDSNRAQNCARLREVLKWEENDDELAWIVEDFGRFAELLQKVPKNSRELLNIVVSRSEPSNSYGRKVLFYDVVEACESDNNTIQKHVKILERSRLAGIDEDFDGTEYIYVGGQDWELWQSLIDFCNKTSTPLSDILVEGRFGLLDSE